MALPEPTYESAKGVFRLPDPSLRRPDDDEPFIRAIRDEFPSVVTRQVLPPEAPPNVPYLALQSSSGSSRLAMSPVGTEFDVRFYDDFGSDTAKCFDYLRRKLESTMSGWAALELQPAFFGLVLIANFSFTELDESAGDFLVRHHTKYEVATGDLNDAQVRVGLKLEDTYFLTLTLTSYETKTLGRPVFAGQQMLNVKPWEGDVVDAGIQLTVDVNNRLSAIVRREDPTVDGDVVEQIVVLAERVTAAAAATFVESGKLNLEELTREVA